MAVMLSANLCAVIPGPGRFLGQEVTMRHSVFDWAIAGVARTGKLAEPAIRPSAARRDVFVLVTLVTPEFMEVVHGA